MIIRPNAGFIIPTRRFVDVGMPTSKVCAAGRYQLVKHERGIELERTPWFDNIILNQGLERWGTNFIIAGAAIGTGTSTPDVTQNGLDTQTHFTTTTGTGDGLISALGSSPYNNTRTFVFRTTLGALNGNYTEVGVGWASGANMFSRALILDGGGSPTSIAVNSAQQLDIVYQLSVFPPLIDIGPDVVTISGVDYDVTGRASSVNDTSRWPVPNNAITFGYNGQTAFAASETIGAITAGPTGGGSGTVGTQTSDAYVGSSLQRTGYESYSLVQGNESGGIKVTRAGWAFGVFQYLFDPVIPKDGTKTLVLNYSINWARRP